MRTSYRLIYIGTSFFAYIALSLIEFFVLTHLLDMVSTKFFVHFVSAIICLLVINPILVYLLLDKLPIRPGRRLKGNINEDLKREV